MNMVSGNVEIDAGAETTKLQQARQYQTVIESHMHS